MIDLTTAADYVRLFRGRTFVIKIGGACLIRPGLIDELGRQIAVIEACGARPIVVHGAGPQVDDVQRSLGEEPTKIGGRRITTDAALGALARVSRGTLGPAIVDAVIRHGSSARMIPAEEIAVADRRPPVEVDGREVDFGLVGDLAEVSGAPLAALTADGTVPVLSPPVADRAGGRLNANADLLAARIAGELEADKLILVTSTGGVLGDPADMNSALSTLHLAQLDKLEARGSLEGGMRVKIQAARKAIAAGVARVHVVSGLEPEALLGELFTTHGTGTLITGEPECAPPTDAAPKAVSQQREARA